METNKHFYLLTFVENANHSASSVELFCFDKLGGLQRKNIENISSNDIIFLNFSVDDLFKFSFDVEFHRLIKKLLLLLGVDAFLNNIFLEISCENSGASEVGIASFAEFIYRFINNPLECDKKMFYPLAMCFKLLHSNVSDNFIGKNNHKINVHKDDEVSSFYKEIVSCLIDEKLAKDDVKGFGLSQSLIVSRLDGLLNSYYSSYDIKNILLLRSLSDKFNLNELNRKTKIALYFLCEANFLGINDTFKFERDDLQFLLTTESALSAQKELRSLFIISSFSFLKSLQGNALLDAKCKNRYILDSIFAFLDDSLELLGHEGKLRDFFYGALKYLNREKKLQLIQVGAFDGVHGDFVHDFLMKEECNALLIEPQKEMFDILQSNYYGSKSNIVFVNKAIGVNSNFIKMYRVKNEFLEYYNRDDDTYLGRIASFDKSYVVDNIASKIRRWGDGRIAAEDAEEFIDEFDVEISDFKDIIDFDSILGNEVILQVDCEGFDFEIIKCFPFKIIRPALIHFESDKLIGGSKSECFRYLRSQGYLLIEHGQKITSDTLALDLKNQVLLDAFYLNNIYSECNVSRGY